MVIDRKDSLNTIQAVVGGKRSHALLSRSLQSTLEGEKNILIIMNNTDDPLFLSGKLSSVRSSAAG